MSVTAWSRFTPTCVGKARAKIAALRGVTVHPHVRGEGYQHALEPANVTGSPPRAWGRRDALL